MVFAPAINAGTFGVAPQDAGVASAALNVGQQLGASIGTSLLNTIFAAAVTAYLTARLASARLIGRQALAGQALLHGYTTAFWWTAGIFAGGAVICGALLRRGPLAQPGTPSPARGAGRRRPRPRDRGGNRNELKDRVGGQILEVELSSAGQRDRAQALLAGVGCGEPEPDERPDWLTLPAPRHGLQLVEEAAAGLRRAQIGVSDIGLRRPTLDDVFLQLTGAPAQRGRRRA
jgi:hypothetical protein